MKKALYGCVVVMAALALALCAACSSSTSGSAASGSSSGNGANGASASAQAQASLAGDSPSAVSGSADGQAVGAQSGNAAVIASDGTLADGQYAIDVVLSGGTGRASVESPAKVIVDDGVMTATIVWSSPNYDQMVVDGTQYFPVPRTGNATFNVGVPALDTEIPIQAETTAMSEPHMIDYTLTFDSSSLKEWAS